MTEKCTKLCDAITDVEMMEDTLELCEVVGAGKVLTIFNEVSNLKLSGCWENNVVGECVVVGVEYFHKYGPSFKLDPSTVIEPKTTSIEELFDAVNGQVNDPDVLLAIEGQLMRVMLKCVYHYHRLAVFRMWVCIAIQLSGFRSTRCFLEHMETMAEENIEDREDLGHVATPVEGVFVGDEASEAQETWALVFCDIVRYRECNLKGVCFRIRRSLMVDEGWEVSANRHLSKRVARQSAQWIDRLVERAPAPTPPQTPKSKRNPLQEMSANTQRGARSGVEQWLRAGDIPVSPRFSGGGSHASFEEVPITPMRGRPMRPEEYYNPRNRV